jgi:hypothetical protein
MQYQSALISLDIPRTLQAADLTAIGSFCAEPPSFVYDAAMA